MRMGTTRCDSAEADPVTGSGVYTGSSIDEGAGEAIWLTERSTVYTGATLWFDATTEIIATVNVARDRRRLRGLNRRRTSLLVFGTP
jgi:hypothetical protein